MTRSIHAVAAGLFVMVLLLAGCAPAAPAPAGDGAAENASADAAAGAAADDGMLHVVSTVSPVTNLIYNVGGDRIQLIGIVPEGVNSHTFEPAPSDARLLAQADLIFVNGLQLEEPTLRLAEANLADGAEIVLLGEPDHRPGDYVDFSFPRRTASPIRTCGRIPSWRCAMPRSHVTSWSSGTPPTPTTTTPTMPRWKDASRPWTVAIRDTVASIPSENRKLLTYHDSWAYLRAGLRHDRHQRFSRPISPGTSARWRTSSPVASNRSPPSSARRSSPRPCCSRLRTRRRSWTRCVTRRSAQRPVTPTTRTSA
ncbi:MAG: metal ABC transporter substrate-binding protein [Caldilineaceae bacterium]